MSLLFRAAVLGGIAYLITRSLSRSSHRSFNEYDEGSAQPLEELHPGESNVWPTSERHTSAANAGPSS